MGIEPTSEAWEASILPLYDARSIRYFVIITKNVSLRTDAARLALSLFEKRSRCPTTQNYAFKRGPYYAPR
jgi:hypothetical protein